MPAVLRLGSRGDDVKLLQTALTSQGFRPGSIDGIFGQGTLAAILGYQRSKGLLADGVVGPKTWASLTEIDHDAESSEALAKQLTVPVIAEMFPFTRIDAIVENLPSIKRALAAYDLLEKPMVLVAFGTIRAETEGFEPISELPSRYNSSPGGHLFDLYDHRRDLGNNGTPDGKRFRGRGFIQLTGRSNYGAIGRYIGLGDELVRYPDRCNEPDIAANVLAAFISMRRVAIKRAIITDDWRQVRRLINGGSHGLARFIEAVRIGDRLLDDPVWPMAGLTCEPSRPSEHLL